MKGCLIEFIKIAVSFVLLGIAIGLMSEGSIGAIIVSLILDIIALVILGIDTDNITIWTFWDF